MGESKKEEKCSCFKKLCNYLRRQTLTDWGTFLLGLSAAYALFINGNVLSNLLQVKNITVKLSQTQDEIKLLSESTDKALQILIQQQKDAVANQIQCQSKNNGSFDKEKIKEEIDKIPSEPDDNEDTSVFLPENEKEELFSEIDRLGTNGTLEKAAGYIGFRQLADRLKVTFPKLGYDAMIHREHKLYVFGGMNSDWIESISTDSPELFQVQFTKGVFAKPPVCHCSLIGGEVESCLVAGKPSKDKVSFKIKEKNFSSSHVQLRISCKEYKN